MLKFRKAMWLILQQKKPNDFVISTGKQTTVKNFVNLVASHLKMKLKWKEKSKKRQLMKMEKL